ncbi:hypothetical protein [Nocardiopsis sp. CNR-923]|uniref:hypothetical protein n=1 Tax=Nocardiopsis sp. CNR-923 TaxID=1904965 RepID=UPI001181747C|nr:hypothetical protein [Nocardiopsis sp. CNR-923]
MSISSYPRYRPYPPLADSADVHSLLKVGDEMSSIEADRANLLRTLSAEDLRTLRTAQDQRQAQAAREAAEE